MSTWIVYLLIDPRDGEIRYVGCSKDPANRLLEHRSAPEFIQSAKRKWFRSVERKKRKVLVEPLVSYRLREEAFKAELEWIRRLRLAGCDLFNSDIREVKLRLKIKSEKQKKADSERWAREQLRRDYTRALVMASWKDWFAEETVKLVQARVEARQAPAPAPR